MARNPYVNYGAEDMAGALSVLAGSILRYYEGKEERKLQRERMGLEKQRLGIENRRADFESRRLYIEEEGMRERKSMNAHNRIMDMLQLEQGRKRMELEERRFGLEEKRLGVDIAGQAEQTRQFNERLRYDMMNFWAAQEAQAREQMAVNKGMYDESVGANDQWATSFVQMFYKTDKGLQQEAAQSGTPVQFMDIAKPNDKSLFYDVWNSSNALKNQFPDFKNFVMDISEEYFEVVTLVERGEGGYKRARELSTRYKDVGFQQDILGMWGQPTTGADRESVLKAILADRNPSKGVLTKIKDRDLSHISAKLSEGLVLRHTEERLHGDFIADNAHYRATTHTRAAVVNGDPSVDPVKNKAGAHLFYQESLNNYYEGQFQTGSLSELSELQKAIWSISAPEVMRTKLKDKFAADEAAALKAREEMKGIEPAAYSGKELREAIKAYQTAGMGSLVGAEAEWAQDISPQVAAERESALSKIVQIYTDMGKRVPAEFQGKYQSLWDIVTERANEE